MRQITKYFYDIDELDTFLVSVSNDQEYKNAKHILALIYFNGLYLYEAEEFTEKLREKLEKAIICGSTVVTSNDTWDFKGITLSLFFSEEAQFKILEYDCDKSDEEIINDIYTEIEDSNDLRAVLCYPCETKSDFTNILNPVSDSYPEIVFFGLIAGARKRYKDDRESIFPELNIDSAEDAYVCGNRFHKSGYVFIFISGETLSITTEYIMGWNPLGKIHIVTEREYDKAGNACIKTIDGAPAGDIYKKYLDVDLDEYFLDNVCEFPFILCRENSTIARVPMFFGKNKELFFSGDFQDDEKIKLSFANPDELLTMTRTSAENISDFEPQAMLLSICINRYFFLKENQRIERAYFKDVLPDLMFGFGGSEILKQNNEGGLLNSAITVLAFREGNKKTTNRKIPLLRESEKTKIKPISERLHTFIDTATKDLEEAYDEAAKANDTKSLFLSNMSHEIRTPINAILGLSEMINRESKDEGIIRYSNSILRASYNLLGIVNDILDFSKVEAGKMDIIPVEYESASLLNDIVTMIRIRIGEKEIELVLDISEDIPHLLIGDEIRIKQVIMNILSNAVKYTEKGKVTFKIRTKKCEWDEKKINLLVSVSDTGIGIKKEDLPNLFNTFERLEERRNRTIEGTGLGMSITRNLLRGMNSELMVESEYGKGSIFSFELVQDVKDWTPIGPIESALNRSEHLKNEYEKTMIAPNARILVVDDTIINLFVVENLLRRTQIIIDTADSGKKCIEMVKKNKYDIIFLDHRMPEMDGVETIKELLKLPELGETPIIALTANAISGSREFYLENGFNDYLSKPIEGLKLEKMIMNYLPEDKYKLKENLLADDDTDIPEEIAKSIIINAEHGVKNCASKKTYMETLEVYYETLGDRKKQIQDSYESRDLENFMISVHSLKSTSKIIGALTLGNYAERIEEACNDKDLEFVHINYPEMILQIVKIQKLLNITFNQRKEDHKEKKKVTEEIAVDAFTTMAELAEMYDYDSMGMLFKKFEEYDIPKEYKELFDRFKNAYQKADWDVMFEVIKEVT